MAKKLGIRTKQALTVLYGGILDKPEFRFLPVSIGQVLVREGYAEQVEGKKYRGKLPYKITPAGATAILGTDYLASAYYDRELPSLDSKAAAPAQPAGDFGAGDKVVIRKDSEQDTEYLTMIRDAGTAGKVVDFDREFVIVEFDGAAADDGWTIAPTELELWKPAEPGSDAKDEYTRDEEQARLIARIRELEEAVEAAHKRLCEIPMQDLRAAVYGGIMDTRRMLFEALAEAQEERG